MITRLALLSVLLLAACGSGGSAKGAGEPSTTERHGVECAPEGDGSQLRLTLAPSGDSMAAGPVTWRLTVTNEGDGDVTLQFASGQQGDVVLRRDGVEVYRWSEGRMFAQAITCIGLAPGESHTVELADHPVDVPPGTYDLEATLTSQPAPPPVHRQLRVL
jgi:hypothetical protein